MNIKIFREKEKKLKKSSQLRKIILMLSIFDTSMLLLNCTHAEAAQYESYTSKIICKQNNINSHNILRDYCISSESSLYALNGSDSKNDDVVNSAYKLIGKPYVYGAAGPNAFDCSGFTQYVYKSTGQNISRTTYTQVKEGIEVRKKDLKPGDLVFFNTSSYMSHVGIYVGNGLFIHAPRTGKPVTVSSLNEGYYCERFATARRIIN